MARKADFMNCDGRVQEGLKQGNDRVDGCPKSTLTPQVVVRRTSRSTGEADRLLRGEMVVEEVVTCEVPESTMDRTCCWTGCGVPRG